jgi:hypothetical protein
MNDVFENPFKQIKNYLTKIKEFNTKNLIIKILLIILLSIIELSFNLIKFDLSLTKEIEMYRNIPPIDIKNKIITIGFYDVIFCDRIWEE